MAYTLEEGRKWKLLPPQPTQSLDESSSADEAEGVPGGGHAKNRFPSPPEAAQESLVRLWLGGLVSVELGLVEPRADAAEPVAASVAAVKTAATGSEPPGGTFQKDQACPSFLEAQIAAKTCGTDLQPGREGFTVDYKEDTGPPVGNYYELQKEAIASGSFGLACPGVHKSTGKQCMVKVVAKVAASRSYSWQLVRRKERLLRMTREHAHPNIVGYLDMLESEKLYFIVMEHLQGPELFEHIIEAFPVAEARCRSWIKQVLSALDYLHVQIGLIHRDVKLENLRFRGMALSGPLVLLDFGFASFITEEPDDHIVGTLGYLAPEEMAVMLKRRPRKVGPPVDVWAAGVVLYILFAGQLPFETDEMPVLAGAKGEAALARSLAHEHLSTVSPEARDLLGRLMEYRERHRITAHEALEHKWVTSSETGSGEGLLSGTAMIMKGKLSLSRSQASYQPSLTLLANNSSLKEDCQAKAADVPSDEPAKELITEGPSTSARKLMLQSESFRW